MNFAIYTPEQLDLVKRMAKEGYAVSRIAYNVGMKSHKVRAYLRSLGITPPDGRKHAKHSLKYIRPENRKEFWLGTAMDRPVKVGEYVHPVYGVIVQVYSPGYARHSTWW